MSKSDMVIIATRRQAWKDLYYFSKYVLGFHDMEVQPHKELCDVLMALAQPLFPDIQFEITTQWVLDDMADPDKLRDKALVMLPRGCFKSTVATQGFPIWLEWHDINFRIMIDTATLSNSKMHLSGIKQQVIGNPLLQAVCVNDKGEYLLEPNWDVPGGFNEDSIIFKHRTKLNLKEPSIFIGGVDNARVGLHMEVLIMDDIVTDINSKTPEQIEKVKDHYRFCLSLPDPGKSITLVIGTRYHMDDLYNELLNSIDFWIIVRPAILPTGELYFPTRLTLEYLEKQKRSQGSFIYSSQYMLTPLAGDNNPIHEEDIMRYIKGKHPIFAKKGITVDLAISEKETADDSVAVVWGQTSDQKIYVIESVSGRFSPFAHIDNIFRLAEKYSIIDVGIETVGYQKSFIYMLEAEMRRRGKHLRIQELKAKGNKMERVMGLVPYVEQHQFFVPYDEQKLLEQLIQFPYAKHDDLVDGCTYITQMLNPYHGKVIPLKRKYKPLSSVTGY